ncbi:c-type cytochrome [Pontibacter actiniarum]|uniref:Cytochrome C n=1 Tax=Pontibacter actiniarum TaxID=323450 RepID=A0A1X9YWK2_9BACT|nr:cytochrome c [Pontibacter actiniarum]ARS37330.1 cytochrome C [Pontibacter actiniarum]
MKKTALLSAGLLFLLSLSFCGTARRGVPMFEPLSISSPAVAQGKAVFKAHCQKCHPGGTAGLGPAINNKPLPGFLIRYQVRHGLGVMPAFKEEVISDQELDHLVAYLKKLRKAKDEV